MKEQMTEVSFQQLADSLPEGVNWGDSLTPSIAQSIWQAALSAVPAIHIGNSTEMVQSKTQQFESKEQEKLERRIKRLSERLEAYKEEYYGKEQILTYHAGYSIGYVEGQLSILEDVPPALSMSQFANKADYEAAMQSQAQQPAQHADDIAIDKFAAAMKAKMAKQREKGYSGWDDKTVCSEERLQGLLLGHVTKGDPVDVGNFAMMLFNRDEQTQFPIESQPAQEPSEAAMAEGKHSITDEQIENIIYQCDGFLKWGVGEQGKQTIREKIRGILGEA